MNLLDENFPKDQLPLLKKWRIPFRLIGSDFARVGIKDVNIIPLLHRHRGVTFFTLDRDFLDTNFSHSAYALVWLDVRADDAAHFMRRFLKHPRFNTRAQRMRIVARVHHGGVDFWLRKGVQIQQVPWRRDA